MIISPKSHIGIIGGAGKTGQQFAALFKNQGCSVDVSDAESAHRNTELLSTCDVVIFSVPLSKSVAIMEQEMSNATREDQLLLDVSSLKTKQVDALLKGAGEVIGMHPLFGPWTDPKGETVILCPARAEEQTIESLERFLRQMGMKTDRMTPEHHDHLMAELQVLPHVKNFLVADVLKRMDADVSEILETCTPPYELELNVVGRFLDDSADLYGPIILDNPDTLTVLRAFASAIDDCIQMAERGDLKRFSDRYEQLRAYFGTHAAEGRKTSEACIRLLSSQPL